MLGKLRNKFLFMNMISTFFLLLISFAVIFYIVYSSTEKEIEKSLFRAFSSQWLPHHYNSQNIKSPGGESEEKREERKLPPAESRFRDAGVFSIAIKEDGTFTTRSFFGNNNELYEEVSKVCIEQKREKGEFKYNGAFWRYETVVTKDGTRLMAVKDISAERDIIKRLVLSFVLCAVLLLMLIYFISLFYANRVIRPVRDAWDKQKRFVADASHELKTPLSAINANIDVVLSHPEGKISDEEKWLTYIKKEAARLSVLTDDLLFMAKLEGEAKTETERINLSEIVESVSLNLEAIAFENGKSLDCSIEEKIYANASEKHFSRLVLILIDNAVKYSPKGDTIKIRFSTQKDRAVLTVKNNGEPIPVSEQKKIFDRFYRADESRSGKNGYGLGLSMAHEIVKVHKGKISVSSDEKNGTVFSVYIPIKEF